MPTPPTKKRAAARKPAAKRPTAKPASKAAAARKEAAGEQPTADFHGVTITLPARMPASFPLRLGKLQHSNDEEGAGAIYALLRGLLSEDDLDAVMDKMDEVGGEFNPLLQELIDTVTGAFGAEPGESNASAGS